MRSLRWAIAACVAVTFLLPAAAQAAGLDSDPFSSQAFNELAAPDPALLAGFAS
jgi:hypothetical protein